MFFFVSSGEKGNKMERFGLITQVTNLKKKPDQVSLSRGPLASGPGAGAPGGLMVIHSSVGVTSGNLR